MQQQQQQQQQQPQNTLDLETMIKRLSIFSTVNIAPNYASDEEDDEDIEDIEEEEEEEEEDDDYDDTNRENISYNEYIQKNNSNVNNDYNDLSNDENLITINNLNNLQSPLNIAIDTKYENKYNNNNGLFLKEIKYNNKNSNTDVSKIEDNYKKKLIKYENEILSLKNELNELKKHQEEPENNSILNNNNNNKNNLLLDEIEQLKNENQLLNNDLKKLKETNTSLQNQVSHLQRYESLYKSREFHEINSRLYQVVSKIGQGGFSEVYHCISFKESKSYALKKVIINDEQNFNFVMNEIELLKRLQSTQKVIQLYDYEYVKSKKTLYLVMEMGSTDLNNFLKKEIQKNQCVKEPTRVYIWYKMLEAVKAIHKEGVIHSDLKPANFLLVGHEVKLIDFNISNAINDRTSVTVVCDCGTLNYMPPESFNRDNDNKAKINQKSDVWSLGCILYLMVYAKLPFQHIKNQFKLMYTLADPNKVIEFPQIHDKSLLDVLKKCLQHDIQNRYSVDELINHPYIINKQ